MFQFLRRVSGSLLPRPDRPWRDDATSNAPTIGRKRRNSVTERDEVDSSSAKRTKRDLAESDPASEARKDAAAPVEAYQVKEVTKGVKEVDLEDRDKLEDAPSIQPEGVPLPDSPSGSPEPESESADPVESDADEETEGQEHADDEDEDAVATPAAQVDAEEGMGNGTAEAGAVATDIEVSVEMTAPAQEVIIATVESCLDDAPEALEVKA